MVTTMTTTENLRFSNVFFPPRLNFTGSCFKMKGEVEDKDEQLEVVLERLGLDQIDYDETNETVQRKWSFLDSDRASRHLSGGGVLTDVVTSTNPFRNHMRPLLDEDNPGFGPTNPFNKTSLQRSSSQCSTRPASPCIPLRPNSFIFTIAPTFNQSTQTSPLYGEGDDLLCLQRSTKALQKSGWYYENINWQDSKRLLQGTPLGTYLVRDSCNANFLFSLSVQTARGPTSVRLHYVYGRFRLDAEAKLLPNIPFFDSVIELIEYYIENTDHKRNKHKIMAKEQVWIDTSGQVYSNIFLAKPLKKQGMTNLQHLCRLKVNQMLRQHYRHKHFSNRHLLTKIPVVSLIDSLDLPLAMREYLKEYPYSK